jgi:hypothetical protein
VSISRRGTRSTLLRDDGAFPAGKHTTVIKQPKKNSQKVRANKKVKKGGERGAFFTGGNSSCRAHIRQHYQLYKDRCKEAGIPESHHAIPRAIWRKMEEEKREKGKTQAKIDGMLKIQPKPSSEPFTRDGVLQAVAQFVACDDQVMKINVMLIVLSC